MKAISRLLIMFSLIVSMTGFSLTTTDLSQNSDVECIFNQQVDLNSIEVVNENILKIDYSIFMDKSLKITFISVNKEFVKPNKTIIDDVGWRYNDLNIAVQDNYKSNVILTYTKKNTRSPRDGLMS